MELKKDAQVMLLWNLSIPDKLANGSRGVVKGFVATLAYHSFLLQEFAKRKGLGKCEKKKTNSGECEKEDNSQESLQLEDEDSKSDLIASFDISGLDVDEIILPVVLRHITRMQEDDLMKEMRSIEKVLLQGSESLPYVQFTNEKSRLVLPQPFGKVFKSCGKAIRWQCPLILAWAIFIHKSQGMTIDWLKVDLQGCFDFGQAYVACSHGRSLKSMVVKNFSLQEIKVSEKVQKFYNSLKHGELYSGTWKDSIYTFDQMAADSMHLEIKMKERYRHSKL